MTLDPQLPDTIDTVLAGRVLDLLRADEVLQGLGVEVTDVELDAVIDTGALRAPSLAVTIHEMADERRAGTHRTVVLVQLLTARRGETGTHGWWRVRLLAHVARLLEAARESLAWEEQRYQMVLTRFAAVTQPLPLGRDQALLRTPLFLEIETYRTTTERIES